MIQFKPYNEPIEFLLLNKHIGKSISFKTGETIKAEVIDILPNGAVIARIKDLHVAIKTEIPLQKETTLLLKVMDSSTTDKKLKLQLIDVSKKPLDIKILNEIKDPEVLLKISQNISDKKELLNLLLFNNLDSQLKNIHKKVKKIISDLKNIDVDTENLEKNFIKISNIDVKSLQKSIENSGVFFENKIKKYLPKEKLLQDIKGKLLELSESVEDKKIKNEIQQTILNIDTYQLFSNLIDGVYTFLPLIWDNLDDGEFIFKKGEKKEQYLCKIVLNFSDIGKVDTTIFMYKNDLKIVFDIENESFRAILGKNIHLLKNELKKDEFENVFISFDKSEDIIKLTDFKSVVDIKV